MKDEWRIMKHMQGKWANKRGIMNNQDEWMKGKEQRKTRMNEWTGQFNRLLVTKLRSMKIV